MPGAPDFELSPKTRKFLEALDEADIPIPRILLDKIKPSTMGSEYAYSETTDETKERVCTPTQSPPTSWDGKQSFYDRDMSPGSVPWPGDVYMIRHRDSGKAITMGIGSLRLEPIGPRGGWHWECTETDGWFGFRNTVSGMFMGHDNGGKIMARCAHHRGWEYFTARANPRGGYELMTLHGWKFKKLDVEKKGTGLVETEGEGALWDFVKIEKDT